MKRWYLFVLHSWIKYSIVLNHTRYYGRIRSNRSIGHPHLRITFIKSPPWLWEFLQHKHISHAALDLFCLKFTPRVNSLTAKLKRFSPTTTLSKAPPTPTTARRFFCQQVNQIKQDSPLYLWILNKLEILFGCLSNLNIFTTLLDLILNWQILQ